MPDSLARVWPALQWIGANIPIAVVLIYIQMICECIYLYNQILVSSVYGKSNWHIDLKKFDFKKYLLGIIYFQLFEFILNKNELKSRR